jgi:ATP-binding cassette subfamily B protein
MFAAKQHGMYIPLFDLASQTTAVIVITAGAWRVSTGAMSVSDLLGFLFFSGLFFGSIIVIAELYNTTLQAMAGGERIFALLDTKPTVVDAEDAVDLPSRPDDDRRGSDRGVGPGGGDERGVVGARIEFHDVSFAYSNEVQVLHGVSFTAAPGETIALVGHTGAGKTTIVNLLARFYDRTGGEIFIDGVPIERVRLASLQSQLGLVLQDNILFAGSVMDNIRFGRPGASDDEVREAAAALDCLDILDDLPEGLYTDVGERGTALSLGQRQLVCFCRAMIARPRISMLDEATSAVDTHTEHKVQTALERLMEGRTNIVVAHRLSTIRSADQILVLDHGRLVERGTHQELIDHSGRYQELYDQFVRLSAAPS